MTAPLLDLSYDDRPLPVDFADGARRLAHRRRRVRRAAGSGAVLVVAAVALAVVVPSTVGHGGSVVGDGGDAVPMNRGDGPTATDLAAPGVTAAGSRSRLERKPVRGHPVVVGEAADGRSVVQYVTTDAFYCLGYRAPDAEQDDVSPSTCSPMDRLPAEGLTLGTGFGTGTASVTGEAPDRSAPSMFVTGIVRGPVDEVRIETPDGSYAARLDPSDVPGVGTFYAASVPVPLNRFADVRRTVLRDGQPVFGCTGYACVTSQG